MSNERSDAASPLRDLERDLPTSAVDVEALRRLREQLPPGLLDVAMETGSDSLRLLASRPTSEGWEDFEL
jgi:hypothetical protein